MNSFHVFVDTPDICHQLRVAHGTLKENYSVVQTGLAPGWKRIITEDGT